MRAQSVRKTIGILNVLLLLGCAGAAAWYVLRVKPALAAGAKPKEWLEKSGKQYEEDRRNVKPAPIYPLKEGELDVIRRPDLSAEAGVWSYVGPVPVPLPKKETVDPKLPPPPEGIDALGKPHLVIVGSSDKKSMVAWKMNSGKIGYFSEGEFLKEKKDDKDRFKLIDIAQPDPNLLVVSITYEVYDDPTKPAVATKTGGPYDLRKKFESKLIGPTVPPGTGPEVAGPGGPGAPPPAPGTAPTGPRPTAVAVEAARPTIKRSGNEVQVEFDEGTYEAFRNVSVEEVLGKVRTEDVVDSRTGERTGVRIADTGGIASNFDVQRGDILKSINGTPVRSRDEAVKVVKALPKETTTVVVVIERNGADIRYTVDPRDPKVRAAAGKLRVGK